MFIFGCMGVLLVRDWAIPKSNEFAVTVLQVSLEMANFAW